ncbi:MAG: GNAT family N-acetyltransferase [Acidimicrobiales bacterium]|nr:GNAT family N-acetyltransferase [Acidimicrobiales bacterium]
MAVFDRSFAELSTLELHDLLRLRVDVFVVEQACPYPELDGRDTETTTRHVWMADDAGPQAYVRLLDDGEARRIGRVATRSDARGNGHAGALVDHVIATSSGPWVLDAQSHLAEWYTARGFVACGPEFVEDGIAHVPMRRDD